MIYETDRDHLILLFLSAHSEVDIRSYSLHFQAKGETDRFFSSLLILVPSGLFDLLLLSFSCIRQVQVQSLPREKSNSIQFHYEKSESGEERWYTTTVIKVNMCKKVSAKFLPTLIRVIHV